MDELYKLLLQAVARGWTHPKNKDKVMDSDLAESIAQEVQLSLVQSGIVKDNAETKRKAKKAAR